MDVDGGELRYRATRLGRVIEAGKHHVVGNGQPTLVKKLHDVKRHEVVCADEQIGHFLKAVEARRDVFHVVALEAELLVDTLA